MLVKRSKVMTVTRELQCNYAIAMISNSCRALVVTQITYIMPDYRYYLPLSSFSLFCARTEEEGPGAAERMSIEWGKKAKFDTVALPGSVCVD